MSQWSIYFNPKCGSCRKALGILESKKLNPTIIEYLKKSPTEKEIDSLLKKLNLEPEELVRKKEKIYSELKLATKKPTRPEWLRLLSQNPILIERPIVVKDNKAIIARPPEKTWDLIK